MIRLSDLYLLYAEAINEVEGPNGAYSEELFNALDAVRERAGIPSVKESWDNFSTRPDLYKSQAGMREIIHRERLIELSFESQRYWDLRRWREAEAELNGPHTGLNYLLDWESYKQGTPRFWLELKERIDDRIQDPQFPANNYYMPIGDGTVALNPNIVENPGY